MPGGYSHHPSLEGNRSAADVLSQVRLQQAKELGQIAVPGLQLSPDTLDTFFARHPVTAAGDATPMQHLAVDLPPEEHFAVEEVVETLRQAA